MYLDSEHNAQNAEQYFLWYYGILSGIHQSRILQCVLFTLLQNFGTLT